MEKLLTSSLVKNQLPNFVRDDYPTFITFLEKYYEWLETNNQVSYEIDALRNSIDLDTADDFYIDKLKNDLAPYFPKEIVADKKLFLKLVAQFYRANGTQDAVKFLFRALFNENIEIYYPKDDILKASDGKWVLPLALRIDTNDNNIFNIEKCMIIGQTTKSTAIVEKVVRSVDRQLGISYTELFISNIQRLFTTGEIITATYTDADTGLDVNVSGRLIGSLSEIKIDPKNRGSYYNGYDADLGYAGDPVTIVGGLNPTSDNPIGALAYVGDTTKGGLTDIIVINSGFGFRDPTINLNSSLIDFYGGFENAPLGQEAKANISLLDMSTFRVMNVSSLTVSDFDGYHSNINVIYSNTISSISTFESLNVYPISLVSLDGTTGGGGGYRGKPTADIYSFYNDPENNNDYSIIPSPESDLPSINLFKGTKIITDYSQDFTQILDVGDYIRLIIKNRFEGIRKIQYLTANSIYVDKEFANDLSGVSIFKINRNVLSDIGALGRISVTEGGDGYQVGDILIFTGGSGYGANAYVSQLHTGNSGIKTVTINNHSSNAYVIGGEGYRSDSLPELTVQSVAGANSVIIVTEVTGDGEKLDFSTSRIGAISTIKVVSYGYDYVDAPVVSLRNMDATLIDVTEGQLFTSNTIVYQGTSNVSTTFKATVDSYIDSAKFIRMFDYKGTLDKTQPLMSDDGLISANVVSFLIYGDGRAKATARFENGLIRHPGLYLNTDGQISADKRIQDGEKYHNFSYVLQTQTSYDKFKAPLSDIVHPVGTKTFVTKVGSIPLNIFAIPYDDKVLINELPDTFDVFVTANSIVSNNVSASLTDFVAEGDYIIISGATKVLDGIGTTTAGSNTIIGIGTNFINDIIDGDIIHTTSGYTETVKSVESELKLYTQNTIVVTDTEATITVLYDDVKRVNSVNANTIIVDTNFTYSVNDATVAFKKIYSTPY